MSNIKIKCPKCRSNEFEVPRTDLRPTDKVKCAKCGFSDTYERIVGPVAKKHVEDELKKAFEGLR
jgi:predicted nucleic-acid-binding Zn-ribbon protein